MFHTFITTVLHWFCLCSVLPIYSIYSSQYLDFKELVLLIIETIMFISLMLPGWIMHCLRLILFTLFSLLCLDICIGEYEEFVGRYEVPGQAKLNINRTYKKIEGKEIFLVGSLRTLKKFKLKETFVIGVVVTLWILIKICYTEAHYYGIGLDLNDGTKFMGFLETLDGWNCTYPEFTYIASLNLFIMLLCYIFLSKILWVAFSDGSLTAEERRDLNSYKLFLQKYLILPSLMVFGVDFAFNLISHWQCKGMLDCYQYYKYGILIYVVMVIGVPLSSRFFFFMKSGRFSLQSERISGGLGSENELGEPLRISSE